MNEEEFKSLRTIAIPGLAESRSISKYHSDSAMYPNGGTALFACRKASTHPGRHGMPLPLHGNTQYDMQRSPNQSKLGRRSAVP